MRTPEQVAADEALTAAIEAIHRAYSQNVEGTLTEYIVVSARQGWDIDGEPYSLVYVNDRDNAVPYHRMLGLSEYAQARIRAVIAQD